MIQVCEKESQSLVDYPGFSISIYQTGKRSSCPSGRRPQSRPGTLWRDYISRLALVHFEILPEELVEVAGDNSV